MFNSLEVNCWPTAQQVLLLKAGLSEQSLALSAWKAYVSQVDIQALDHASDRLLPLVYCNLKDAQLDSPEFQTCRSTYRHTWARNQLLFNESMRALNLLRQHNIQAVLLKGAAQSIYYNKSIGSRMMGDVDILVSEEQALKAVQLLMQDTWQLKYLDSKVLEDKFFLARYHALGLMKSDDLQIDLHWRLALETGITGLNPEFLSNSLSYDFNGVTVEVLRPEDHLLHTFIHGLKYSPEPLIRWIPDAVKTINSHPNLDWSRLLKFAKQASIVLPVREALFYLKDNFAIAIPESIYIELQNYPVSKTELRFFKRSLTKKHLHPLYSLWDLHSQNSNFASVYQRLKTFPRFLKNRWELKHSWLVPFFYAEKFFRYSLGRLKSYFRIACSKSQS